MTPFCYLIGLTPTHVLCAKMIVHCSLIGLTPTHVLCAKMIVHINGSTVVLLKHAAFIFNTFLIFLCICVLLSHLC